MFVYNDVLSIFSLQLGYEVGRIQFFVGEVTVTKNLPSSGRFKNRISRLKARNWDRARPTGKTDLSHQKRLARPFSDLYGTQRVA